jgi:hypothetical protein
MVELRQNLCFPLKPPEPLAVVREMLRRQLHCNIAKQLCVSGAIHHIHAALAERRHDLVRSEASAKRDGHKVAALSLTAARFGSPYVAFVSIFRGSSKFDGLEI